MTPRKRTPDPGPLALLAAILTGRPSLPDAACRGMAPLFDPDPLDGEDDTDRTYRLITAARICERCAHTTRCPDSLAARPHQEMTA